MLGCGQELRDWELYAGWGLNCASGGMWRDNRPVGVCIVGVCIGGVGKPLEGVYDGIVKKVLDGGASMPDIEDAAWSVSDSGESCWCMSPAPLAYNFCCRTSRSSSNMAEPDRLSRFKAPRLSSMSCMCGCPFGRIFNGGPTQACPPTALAYSS